MEFIIITGLSGAGKSNAMRIMEDIGYYCVDNIPPVLIPTFYSLCEKSTDKHLKKVAIVTDIRGGDVFDALFDALNKLKSNNNNYKILYLDAKDIQLTTSPNDESPRNNAEILSFSCEGERKEVSIM